MRARHSRKKERISELLLQNKGDFVLSDGTTQPYPRVRTPEVIAIGKDAPGH
jgi:hypothetical protein